MNEEDQAAIRRAIARAAQTIEEGNRLFDRAE